MVAAMHGFALMGHSAMKHADVTHMIFIPSSADCKRFANHHDNLQTLTSQVTGWINFGGAAARRGAYAGYPDKRWIDRLMSDLRTL